MGSTLGEAYTSSIGGLVLRYGARPVASADTAAATAEKIMLRVFFCTAGRKMICFSGLRQGRDSSGRRQDREILEPGSVVSASEDRKCRQGRAVDALTV